MAKIYLATEVTIELNVCLHITGPHIGARDTVLGLPGGPPIEPDEDACVEQIDICHSKSELQNLIQDKLNHISDKEWFELLGEE